MCEEAEKRNASDIFISAGFPPAIKVGGTLTPMPHKALTGADTAAIAESTMNPDQLEASIVTGKLTIPSNRAATRATASTPTTSKAASAWYYAASAKTFPR